MTNNHYTLPGDMAGEIARQHGYRELIRGTFEVLMDAFPHDHRLIHDLCVLRGMVMDRMYPPCPTVGGAESPEREVKSGN